MANNNFKRNDNKPRDEFDHKVVEISRVVRVVAGGRRFRFRAAVVVGDRKGKVGLGVAKGADVAGSIEKAIKQAKKHLITTAVVDNTIPYAVNIKHKAARVLLRPATEGTGLIAGGAVRAVVELAGIHNIVSKVLGSSNKIANVRATLEALSGLEVESEVLSRRGMKIVAKPTKKLVKPVAKKVEKK